MNSAFAPFGVPVSRTTSDAVVQQVVSSLRDGIGGTVYSVNLDTLRQSVDEPAAHGVLHKGTINIPDGAPLIWASRAAGMPLPERVPGSSLVPALCAAAEREGLGVFLLGGNEGAAEKAAQALLQGAPRLDVRGHYCPPFGFESIPSEVDRAVRMVTESKADIVFVGLGFPKQEHLTERLRVNAPGAWFVSCGITFSFLAGDLRRAPHWVQRSGLEWLHRFAQEPKRLFRRYFVLDSRFALRLLRESLRLRRQPNQRPPA